MKLSGGAQPPIAIGGESSPVRCSDWFDVGGFRALDLDNDWPALLELLLFRQ